MTGFARVRAEAGAGWRSFVRRRTAMFFTFGFPLILVGIFGIVVQTTGTHSGLFARSTAFYLPGYLAVVVLFTPLTRVGSSIARHRDGNRFEKLATTPLSQYEWLAAHTAVNAAIILVACALIVGLLELVTGGTIPLSPLVLPFVCLAVVVFCGLGAILGRLAGTQDGVVAASNAVALPLVFLSETFVTADLLPAWFRPAVGLSPLTYFSRGVRQATVAAGSPLDDLVVLAALAVVFFVLGAKAVPQRR